MNTETDQSLDWCAPFCDHEPSRYALQAPWTYTGFLYATNGFGAIECDTIRCLLPEGKVPNVRLLLDDMPDDLEWTKPDASPVKPDGVNELWRAMYDCELCDGTGDHDCDCIHCEAKCEDCEGSGKAMNFEPSANEGITWSGAYIKRRMAWAVARLPGVRVATSKDRLWFRFDGGRGCVCGLVRTE